MFKVFQYVLVVSVLYLNIPIHAETKIVNDLVIAISMPSFHYPLSELEQDIRDKMKKAQDYFPQVTRGAIQFNFDLDQDGVDDLFHVTLAKDIDPCEQRSALFEEAVQLAKIQKPNIIFNHKTLLIRTESCTVPGPWSAMAIGADRILSKGTSGI